MLKIKLIKIKTKDIYVAEIFFNKNYFLYKINIIILGLGM